MDRKLRKRIIGAVVLGAFLVIFVPEWLDGAGHKSRYSNNVEIPPRPEFKAISEYMESTASAATINKRIQSAESSVHAWALQLGSFSKEVNAIAMRDKLRVKGYASYVDVQKKPGRNIYRVRIGPELNKKRLEILQVELIKKEKMQGMVVKHP